MCSLSVAQILVPGVASVTSRPSVSLTPWKSSSTHQHPQQSWPCLLGSDDMAGGLVAVAYIRQGELQTTWQPRDMFAEHTLDTAGAHL